MKPRLAFLSHASPDRATAARIAATLERHGVSVWYSATAIHGAQEWQKEIGRALRR